MIKRINFSILNVFIFTLFFVQGALADEEVVLKRVFTSSTPIFMAGHNGEFEWIEGFDFTCNILLNGKLAGTCTGENKMLNPPQNLVERYDNWMIKMYNTISGIGTFEITGIATSMGGSDLAVSGDITFAWHGSLSNGTGAISDIYGWSGGAGSVNLLSQEGECTDVILYRIGY